MDKKESIKNQPKIDPKRHPKNDRNVHRFVHHLGSVLGAKLEPCWPLFPPKTPQDAPKTPQDAQPERERSLLGASWDRSFFGCLLGSIFWSSWLHFDTQVGTMLATFSAQEGRRCEVQPSFLMRWRFSLIFSPS